MPEITRLLIFGLLVVCAVWVIHRVRLVLRETGRLAPEPGRRRLLLAPVAALLNRPGVLQSFFTGSGMAQQPIGSDVVPVGLGSYSTRIPPGQRGPQPRIYRAPWLSGPVPTGKWWSSLAWKIGAVYSSEMYPHPLSIRVLGNGLSIGYPNRVQTGDGGRRYSYAFAADLMVGAPAMQTRLNDVLVGGYSDWAVLVDWNNNALQATLGTGLPFVYFRMYPGIATIQVSFATRPTVLRMEGSAVHVVLNERAYGIFAPMGAVWQIDGLTMQMHRGNEMGGSVVPGYFSVAALPDTTPETFDDFRAHAFAFVTGTRAEMHWSEADSTARIIYTVETEVMEGTEDRPLLALYRHQWRHTDAVNTSHTYVSPRGDMKVVRAKTFEVSLPFTGVLPWLPGVGTADDNNDREQLREYLMQVARRSGNARLNLPGPGGEMDTYWTGKGLGRLAMLVPIAEHLGELQIRDSFLASIKEKLQDWFTVSETGAMPHFYYDSNWGALIGYPGASFGYQTMLNDHHFHHGYFVMAAAIVAIYDPAWAAPEAWGGMVNLLIRDANEWSRVASMFPRLRGFDVYAGHSWASGAQDNRSGANQESSSEAMNFAAALVLWGTATSDHEALTTGITLYASEMQAIRDYWFDVDNEVFPDEVYPHATAGIVWQDGAHYTTWWTRDPEAIHAINFLPITGGSLYLGQYPDYLLRNDAYLRTQLNGRPERAFMDILWSTLALADPDTAIERFGPGEYPVEWGESRAHTFHWIHSLQALGRVEPAVHPTTPTPLYAVFQKDGRRTYVVYNTGEAPQTVVFSDGMTFEAAPRTMTMQGYAGGR